MKPLIYNFRSCFLLLLLTAGITNASQAQIYSTFASPAVNTHYSFSYSGICVLCDVDDPAYACNMSLTDYTHVYITLGLFNGITYRAQLSDTANLTAGVMVRSRVGLLNASLLNCVTLRTYYAGALRETFSGSSLIALDLLGGGCQNIRANTSMKFNEVEIELNATASLLWDLDLFYAFGTATPTPLPVDWTHFDAELKPSKDVKLSWGTIAETNNKGFHIMHSTDDINYTEIGYTSTSESTAKSAFTSYDYIHQSPRLGVHYYKIAQEDLNGNLNYSNVLKKEVVFNEKYETFVRVQPNPVNAELLFETNKPVTKMTIFNHMGQLITEQDYTKVFFNTINTSALSSGTYFLRLEGDTFSEMVKFVKN